METIPNWFRWLIIAIAALVLCACRAPLQGRNGVQSILVRKNTQQPQADLSRAPVLSAQSDGAINSYDAGSLLSKLNSIQPHESLPVQYQARLASLENAGSRNQASAVPQPGMGRANNNASSYGPRPCPPPVIFKQGERIRTFEQSMLSKNVKAPIYFHVDDPLIAANASNGQIQQTQAQTQAIQPQAIPTQAIPTQAIQSQALQSEVGSPFLDDPVLPPVIDSRPAAPTVEPGFSELGIAPQSDFIPQGETLAPATPIIDEQSIPLAPEYMEAAPPLPAPYDYLPQESIPVEVPPEKWATTPSETMNTSFAQLARRYPDEYICDGGDAAARVRVFDDWTVANLNPEDTVGHYDTVDGGLEVEPSNRVCIYAPRFAAVRKVTSPFQNEKREQVLIEKKELPAVTEQQEWLADEFQQNVTAERHVLLQPASTVQSDLPGVTGVHTQLVRTANHDLSVHEDFRVMRLGLHKQAEKARLASFAAKAITWSQDVGVQVLVDEVIAQTNVSRKGIETVHTIGDNRPAKLRVIKTASAADALPGEEIEFTLRFDNIGHQPMGNVTIIDNLTTRLEYLDDTQECSVKANFVPDPNEVDSLILRWEIIDPIPPGKGGLIRFRCRLR